MFGQVFHFHIEYKCWHHKAIKELTNRRYLRINTTGNEMFEVKKEKALEVLSNYKPDNFRNLQLWFL
jgi:hypothetical protein